MSGVTQHKGGWSCDYSWRGVMVEVGDSKRVILAWRNYWTASVSWSKANSEPCQTLITELKAVTYFGKTLHQVLQGSKCASDDDCCYERAFLLKQKYCLVYFLKRHNHHLFLTMAILIKWMMAWMKKVFSCLKNQTENTAIGEWNEDTTI